MSRVRALGPGELKRHTLPPVTGGDKDRHGSLLVIAGSRDVPGAALLAGEAAMRAGAGRLQCAVPDCMALPLGLALPFAMVAGYSTARDGGFSRRAISPLVDRAAEADAIVAGPGLRGNPAAEKLAGALLALGKPLALDAALLHALPGHDRAARRAAVPPLLLPHAGELASLLGCAEEDVTADPLAAGRAAADRYDALVLVKGVASHVVAPDGQAWRYAGGGPGLGVSGSGDVLAGIAGGLLARGAAPLSALLWAVWLHGEAGRALSKRVGSVGFLASEIAAEVPALLS